MRSANDFAYYYCEVYAFLRTESDVSPLLRWNPEAGIWMLLVLKP